MKDGSTTQQLQNLLNRYAAGDEAARALLIERAYHRLVFLARKLLNSFPGVRVEEETTGILHDTYKSLSSALKELKPRSVREFMALATLEIRRVLLSKVRDLRGRGKNPHPRKVSLSAGETSGGEQRDMDVADGSDPTGESSMTLDVVDAVSWLPEEERETVDLLFFHGLTQAEAAEILETSVDTVKRRWNRARQRLAIRLNTFSDNDAR